jgi:hypothetical protein
MRKFDSIVGVTALLVAVTTFLAQESHSGLWKYVLAFCPIVSAALIIFLYRGYLRVRSFLRMVSELKANYDLVTGANVTSQLVVRVMNTGGDITYERRIRYELIKNNVCVKRTKQDLIASEAPLGTMPPHAKVLNSKRVGTCLTPSEHTALESMRSGRKHFDYRWRYDISPQLTKRGDFVEYEYTTMIPESEQKAFTPEGGVFFFEHDAGLMDITCTLISPPMHRIEILKYHIEQHDGAVDNIPDTEKPRLEANGHSLKWKPGHRKGAAYVCCYRIVAT